MKLWNVHCPHATIFQSENSINRIKKREKSHSIWQYQKKAVPLHPLFERSSALLGEKLHGKLSEWSKEPHSKCGIRITSYRGFESLTFRKKEIISSKSTNCFNLCTELKQFSFLTTGN